jgi:mono/diheme cytochrome c family protein
MGRSAVRDTARSGWRIAGLMVALSVLQGQPAHAAPAAPAASGPAAMFEKQCYSCHNIGGADKKGPDLMNLLKKRDRAWLHRFITSPITVKNSGDPEAAKLFKKYAPEEMPDQMLSPDQIDQILTLIEAQAKKKKPFVPTSGRLARRPTLQDIPAGMQLFTGQTKLAQGGAACISCHSVARVGPLGGGALGPDLTSLNRRYTEVELASILKAPAFPTMSKLFANHTLTNEEVVKLFAYLQSVRTQTPDVNEAGMRYVGGSVTGLLLALGGLAFLGRGRLRGVRKPLVGR